ncbi:unnamed protein product, partial [Litomosoides sigmodontis]
MATNEAEMRQTELEYRILNLDFNEKKFTELENLQIAGRLQEVSRIASKHLDNKHLIQYIARFRKQQFQELSSDVFLSENNFLPIISGLSLIHVAVCNERHEIVEYLASAFPKSIDILDADGRAAVHYAATQKNAIYDTLIDCGADSSLADSIGITAAQYRENADATITSPLLTSNLTFKHCSLTVNPCDV